jgi:hypothetical protein
LLCICKEAELSENSSEAKIRIIAFIGIEAGCIPEPI